MKAGGISCAKSNEGLECKNQEIQTFSSIQRQFKVQVTIVKSDHCSGHG